MKVKVGEHGVTVPKHMLGNVDEVKIRDENGRVVLKPVRSIERESEDPIVVLGQDPVSCGVPDASTNHDQHLYGT